MRKQALLLASALLACPSVHARSINKGDPWDPSHINNLPVIVRDYVSTICKGPPRAQRDFATYNPQERRWRLNIEYLRCAGLAPNFRQGGNCLNVDFVDVGSGYRLARKQYAECGY